MRKIIFMMVFALFSCNSVMVQTMQKSDLVGTWVAVHKTVGQCLADTAGTFIVDTALTTVTYEISQDSIQICCNHSLGTGCLNPPSLPGPIIPCVFGPWSLDNNTILIHSTFYGILKYSVSRYLDDKMIFHSDTSYDTCSRQ
jgi:hypothetical protein